MRTVVSAWTEDGFVVIYDHALEDWVSLSVLLVVCDRKVA